MLSCGKMILSICSSAKSFEENEVNEKLVGESVFH
jgi:hypothetical protein